MEWTKLFKVSIEDAPIIESWSCSRYVFAVDPKTGVLWTKET